MKKMFLVILSVGLSFSGTPALGTSDPAQAEDALTVKAGDS